MENTDDVTLTCNEATTYSVTSYEWYFNNVKKDGETAKTLRIGTKRSATGKYECKVVTGSVKSVKSIQKIVLFLCELYSFFFRKKALYYFEYTMDGQMN